MLKAARKLCLFVGLVGLVWSQPPLLASKPQDATLAVQKSDRPVYLLGQVSEVDTIRLTAALAANRHPNVILFDTLEGTSANKTFLEYYRPTRVIAVGQFSRTLAHLGKRLHFPIEEEPFTGSKTSLAEGLFSQAKKVVICPEKPRSLLLQAAFLAGTIRAPLHVLTGEEGEVAQLQTRLAHWQTQEIVAVGYCGRFCRKLGIFRLTKLADEAAVLNEACKRLAARRTIKTLVVANPADNTFANGGLSVLAPWIAGQKNALLLLTNPAGKDVAKIVTAACQKPDLAQVDSLLLLGDLQAIPMERRPNPLSGKDQVIDMEPLTPGENQPISFAIGRLFHPDRAVAALMVARGRLLAEQQGDVPKALLVSNPGGGLPLLETLSRNTAQEIRNAGFQVTSFFGREAEEAEIRRLLPAQTIFLWEGHHSTLFRNYEAHTWSEPLRPSLIFLQSCLALEGSKAGPFLNRGAVGVIGTSTRTYSASGGAFAMAFFDALLYDRQTLGGSLRQAKNFMLAFAQLKEKRLGQAKLAGANIRAAWAFSLWGDPTLRLPLPAQPPEALPRVRHHRTGSTLIISLPDVPHEKVTTAKYQAEIMPNARLAGLVSKRGDAEVHPLVPLLFLEIPLKKTSAGRTPLLRSRLPENNWVFCWDQRRKVGYLLIRPRARDRQEIRFAIDWQNPGTEQRGQSTCHEQLCAY